MKKVLATVAVSTALIMGGAAAASAAGIEVDGLVRIRGANFDKTLGVDKPAQTNYDQKVQVGFKSKVSDQLTGYIRLGTGTVDDNFTWGNNGTTTTGVGQQEKLGTEMRLDEAWIDYKPGSWGIKAGRQHSNLGGNNFWDHRADAPDSVISLYGDLAGTKLRAMTVKMQENSLTNNADDLDAYILTLDRKFSDSFKGGLNYTHIKGGSENDAGLHPGMALSNLGANAMFKSGGLTLKGDVNVQFGTFSDDGTTEVDKGGYAFQLNAEYKMGKSKVGAMFAQGSGDDNTTDNDHDNFLPYLFSTYRHNSLAGYALPTPGSNSQGNTSSTSSTGFGKNSGLSNLTIMQLNAGTDVTCALTGKPLHLFAALNYLQTTEDVADANGNMTDDLGTELHAKAAWKLTSNLTYLVEGFYLWTDDGYTASAGTMNIDDVYWLRHGITMKF